MPYDTDNDPYVDPHSGVLRNKLGITDQTALAAAEASISVAAIALLKEQPVAGNFDLDHLCALHREIFGDLYPWAGQLRTVEMTKDTTRFANPDFIVQAAAQVSADLHAEQLLVGLDEPQFVSRFAHYYGEINILHPFREGNGRTQRAFCTLLAAQAGYELAWERMNVGENIKASIAAYDGDESQLVTMLGQLL